MLKKIVAATTIAIASVGVAHADILAHINTIEGGELMFSNVPCASLNPPGLDPAMTRHFRSMSGWLFDQVSTEGKVQNYGCYRIEAGIVYAEYVDGQTRSFAASRLEH